jgi:hypothetical protein
MNTGFDEVTAALTRAGVSASFTGVQPSVGFAVPRAPMLAWNFQLSTPLTKLAEALTQLTSAGSRVGTGFSLDFDVQNLETSEQPACR